MTSSLPSLDLMIGELFICGFDGETLPEGLATHLRAGRCGGMILFSRNITSPTQVATLNRSISETASHSTPWIAVDQEGGRVARLRGAFTELPPAAVLGELDDPTRAHRFGQILGEEAAAAGFNFVLAPILDTHTNPANPIIGNRALAQEPEAVARLAIAYTQGLIDAGVMPCGKHFPGHGDTDQDSHLTLPTVSHDLARMEAVELLPFRRAAAADIPAIMSAHVLFPALDQTWPATLSPTILDGILRQTWGYEGLLVSDDLEMKGVADHHAIETIVVQGLKAGIDIFLLCRHWEVLERAHAAIHQALEQGTLTEARLQASWQRIQRAKERFLSKSQSVAPSAIDDFLSQGYARHEDALAFQEAWLASGKA